MAETIALSADLHAHTTLSDGATEPSALLRQAKAQRLTHVAITDHDHFSYTPQLAKEAQSLGLCLLPGVELSTWDARRQRKVHLLCYFPKHTEALIAHCEALSRQRVEAGEEMIALVQQHYPITREEVYAHQKGCASLYRQHIMRALMDYGYTDRLYGDLYRTLFSPRDGIAFRQVTYPSLETVLSLIHGTGGLCILAHPYEYRSLELMEELVSDHQLDGIEVRHSRCTPEGEAYLAAFAQKHGLLQTAGSDFHGMHCSKPSPLGNRRLNGRELSEFLSAAGMEHFL